MLLQAVYDVRDPRKHQRGERTVTRNKRNILTSQDAFFLTVHWAKDSQRIVLSNESIIFRENFISSDTSSQYRGNWKSFKSLDPVIISAY